MRASGLVVVLGAACCVATWLIVTGWAQPRPPLERALRHLHRTDARRDADERSLLVQVGDALFGQRQGRQSPNSLTRRTAGWRQPLRLVDRSVATHTGMLASAAAIGLVLPALTITVLQLLGVLSTGIWVPAIASLGAAIVLPWAVHAETMARSADRRIDIRHQLSAYLDMVTMLLAGNTGYEGALEEAARGGDGQLFRELRRRMREMATTGRSLVGALALAGEEFGVVELEQVAATASLSAAEGAPVARTLASKCSTLRSTLAAEQETAARIRTDKVTPPLVGMAVLFMALIIYPALNLN